MKRVEVKRLLWFLVVCMILMVLSVGNAKAYTWYDENDGEASISGSYYIGIAEYTTNALLLGERCICWQDATAKGSMYVYGYAISTGSVTGSIYWYTRGHLAAGGIPPGGFDASILIKFQAYDITADALYEKVILDKHRPWSDEGTWRWDSMSIPLYYGHEYKFSIYAEVHAHAYGLDAAVADFGGVWFENSKIQWGYISVPNMFLAPPINLEVRVPQAPPEGVRVWIDGASYRAYASAPVIALVESGYHTLEVERNFLKEEWMPGYYYVYTFDHWSDGSTDNPRTVYLTADATFTAYYWRSKYPIL